MLSDFSIEMQFVLCVFAVWRITHFFVAEDGPLNIVVRLRAKLGDSEAGKVMDCFYCTSIWVSLLFAFFLAQGLISWIVCVLALSGAASFLWTLTKNKSETEL